MEFYFEIIVDRMLEDIKASISDYLIDDRYRVIFSSFEKVEFERGNSFKNYFTLNPAKWKTNILVEFFKISRLETKVIVHMDISTVGQTITLKENNFWIQYSENVKKSIIENTNYIKEDRIDGKKVASFNLYIFRWLAFGTLIYFTLVFTIFIITQSKFIIQILLFVYLASCVYLVNKISKKK
jgi:hypothetical protein